MRKMSTFALAILTFLFGTNIVSALCEASEMNRLNTLAVNVRSDFEEIEEVMDPDEYDLPDGTETEELPELKRLFFKVNIYNVTDELYVLVHNNVTNETKKFTYQDSKDGVISFIWDDLYSIVNYTITVYSSDKTNCVDTKLHTLYQTTPRFNEYSSLAACDNADDFYLCHKYITVETTDFSNFIAKVDEYKKGKVNEKGEEIVSPNKKNENFISEYKNIIIAVSAAVVIVGVISVVVVIIRRSGKNEK